MEPFDVAVVGGGPIGATAARHAALHGARVVLIEQHAGPRRPAACAGLISPRTLTTLGASADSVLHEIRSVVAISPSGHRLSLRSEERKALVVDRTRLDRELLERARDADVELRLATRAVGWQPGRLSVRDAAGAPSQIAAKILIGADGPRSRAAGWLGIGRPPIVYPACQAIVKTPIEPETVNVFVGTNIAPHFFAWAVPDHPGRVRVGLAVPEGMNAAARLEAWLTVRYPGCCVSARVAGAIPLARVESPIAEGGLLVGDAAGQVKPISGGGLYTGGLCAVQAGRFAALAALSGQTSRADLRPYAAACEDAIGAELRFGSAVRRAVAYLSDANTDALFAAADDPHLLGALAQQADIDELRRLPRHLIAHPTLWTHLVPLLGDLSGRDGPDPRVAE